MASAPVRSEWRRRIEAEYRSCAAAHHLTLWLIQVGASPDLIHAGLSIADDELIHAGLSHEVYVAAGGSEPPHLPAEELGLVRRPDEPLEVALLRAGVDIFCLGETVAVPLFKALRQGTTVAVARRALDRVLRDEVRHRDFGWTLLDWLLGGPQQAALRRIVDAELPAMFGRLYQSYGQSDDPSPLSAEDREWGLMPAADYAAVLQRTFRRDYLPRFQRLGIDAAPAWAQATG